MDSKRSKINEDVYSYIEINKTSKKAFYLMMIIAFIATTTAFMSYHTIKSHNWVVTVIPVIVSLFIVTSYPLYEKWIYKPWQVRAQKYERHYRYRD